MTSSQRKKTRNIRQLINCMAAFAVVGISIPSSAQDANLDEIIVTGTRIYDNFPWWTPWPSFFYTMPNFGPNFPGAAGATPTGPSAPVTADKIVAIKITNPANGARIRAAATKLSASVAQVSAKIAALADTAVVKFFDGQTMTGAQAKAVWAQYNFTVSDVAPPNPSTMGGVLGNPDPVTGRRADTFYFTTVEGYDAINALPFIVLHEVSHGTADGLAYGQSSYSQYSGDMYDLRQRATPADYRTNHLGYFGDNEAHTNTMARDFSVLFGFPAPANPNAYGYSN